MDVTFESGMAVRLFSGPTASSAVTGVRMRVGGVVGGVLTSSFTLAFFVLMRRHGGGSGGMAWEMGE